MGTFFGYLENLLNGKDLEFDQAREMLDSVLGGEIPESQIAAFLTAGRIKGFAASELAGFASSLRGHAVKVELAGLFLVETCGTGGATVKTFNISTAAAIVTAGAGVHVAKHGNSAITSNSGSADVLKELGVKIDCEPAKIAECIKDAKVGFMFAPRFHPAMKYVQPVRKALGFRTVFNLLGPLSNPANADAQVLGVADKSLMRQMAEALAMLGVKRAMVVHCDGMDEIGTAGPTDILEVRDGAIMHNCVDPAALGISGCAAELMKVANPAESADIIRAVIEGKNRGSERDIVALNAAAAIIVAGLADRFEEAVVIAYEAIDNGRAEKALDDLV